MYWCNQLSSRGQWEIAVVDKARQDAALERGPPLHYLCHTTETGIYQRSKRVAYPHVLDRHVKSFRPGNRGCTIRISSVRSPCSSTFKTVLPQAGWVGVRAFPQLCRGVSRVWQTWCSSTCTDNQAFSFSAPKRLNSSALLVYFSRCAFTVNINQKWGTSQRIQH